MAKKDKTFSALEIVHAALKPLKTEERQRVLASINAMLEIQPATQSSPAGAARGAAGSGGSITPTRPLAIRELIQDKHPKSHPQFIALFAYYREKYQNLPTFSRDELEKYYSDSREAPPSNYARDFVSAIGKGWIHEDGANSYITSKGIEAVETGFSREIDAPPPGRRVRPRTASTPRAAKKPRRR